MEDLEYLPDPVDVEPDTFWSSTWSGWALLGGAVVIVLMWAVRFVPPELIEASPPWVFIVVGGILPQLLICGYALLARQKGANTKFEWPAWHEVLLEAAIALLATIISLFVVGAYALLVEYFFPEAQVSGTFVEGMRSAPPTPFVLALLLMMFTVAPVCEELFFRGFLLNALRQRMPTPVAILLSSVVFGAIHTFGGWHAIGAGILGVMFASVYVWRKTLLTPMLMHAMNNFLVAAVLMASMLMNQHSAVIGISPEPDAADYRIGEVYPGSPAEQAGLKPGDVITHIDEEPINDFSDLTKAIKSHKPGVRRTLTVRRDEETLTISVIPVSMKELRELPAE